MIRPPATRSQERIAVLMTCYNRRADTLASLEALFRQELPASTARTVYLLDDASSDGTSSAVKARFPDVVVLEGTGSLYWCGGMRQAWKHALRKRYSRYLWLNDDTYLLPGALKRLLDVDEAGSGIVVGSCCDPVTGKHTYGGRVRRKSYVRLPTQPLKPAAVALSCETMNGNIVLVSHQVVERIGILSSAFSHLRGDVDYGLRARNAGISIQLAPGYLGTCARHRQVAPWADPAIPFRQRLRYMCEPKGIPPHEWYVYVRRHTGVHWPYYFFKPFVRVVVPWLWLKVC
jgi:GT2 family glycosyltransferase